VNQNKKTKKGKKRKGPYDTANLQTPIHCFIARANPDGTRAATDRQRWEVTVNGNSFSDSLPLPLSMQPTWPWSYLATATNINEQRQAAPERTLTTARPLSRTCHLPSIELLQCLRYQSRRDDPLPSSADVSILSNLHGDRSLLRSLSCHVPRGISICPFAVPIDRFPCPVRCPFVNP
jgi:hypothetical protein